MNIGNLILIALFIEAAVEALKPIWKKDEKMPIAQIVSMAIGIVIAIACKINMAQDFMPVDAPAWVGYIWYVLTGVAIGRGPSFVNDVWDKIKSVEIGNFAAVGIPMEEAIDVDLNIENWSLQQLIDFCKYNGIKAEGCVTCKDYINAICAVDEKPPAEVDDRDY